MKKHAPEIELSKVSYSVADRQLLSDVSLQVARGSITIITGPNGEGKSSLLEVIGLQRRKGVTGRIWVRDQCIDRLTTGGELAKVRQSIGFMAQWAKTDHQTTVFDNLYTLCRIRDFDPDFRDWEIESVLEMTGLEHRADISVNQLNAGDRRRLALASAIVGVVQKLILADEPTENLSDQSTDEMITIFKRLRSRGYTIVMVSHDLGLIRKLGAVAWQLKDGTLRRIKVANNQRKANPGSFVSLVIDQPQQQMVIYPVRHACISTNQPFPDRIDDSGPIDIGLNSRDAFEVNRRPIHENTRFSRACHCPAEAQTQTGSVSCDDGHGSDHSCSDLTVGIDSNAAAHESPGR